MKLKAVQSHAQKAPFTKWAASFFIGLLFSVHLIPQPALAANSCQNIFQLKLAPALTPALASAAKNLLAYESSVTKQILEREYVIDPFLVSLIAKEHMLLIGPPGNAKTTLSKLLMNNIVDAQTGNISFYSMQMNKEITLSDTHGSINFKELSNGVVSRNYHEGLLGAKMGFIDEAFDIRPGAFRNILDVLAERSHSQGTTHHAGKTEVIIAATNKTLPEVYEEFNNSEQPRALIDRFAFVLFIPKEMNSIKSDRMIFSGTRSTTTPVSKLTFQDLDTIRALTKQVNIPDSIADLASLIHYRLTPDFESREVKSMEEYREKVQSGEHTLPPFRASKYLSPRTLAKAGNILKAIVVLDYIRQGGNRSLNASIDDLSRLRSFYQMNGPAPKDLEIQLSRASKEYEQEQIKSVRIERDIVNAKFDSVLTEYDAALKDSGLSELTEVAARYKTLTVAQRRQVADKIKEVYMQGMKSGQNTSKDDVPMTEIVALTAVDQARLLAKHIWEDKAENAVKSWDRELAGSGVKITPRRERKNRVRYFDANEAKNKNFSASVPSSASRKIGEIRLVHVQEIQNRGANTENLSLSGDGSLLITYLSGHIQVTDLNGATHLSKNWNGPNQLIALGENKFLVGYASTRSAYAVLEGTHSEVVLPDRYRTIARGFQGSSFVFSAKEISEIKPDLSISTVKFMLQDNVEIVSGGVIPNSQKLIALLKTDDRSEFSVVIKDQATDFQSTWDLPNTLFATAPNLEGARILMASSAEGIIYFGDNTFVLFHLGKNAEHTKWRYGTGKSRLDISPDGEFISVVSDDHVHIFNAASWINEGIESAFSLILAEVKLNSGRLITNAKFSPSGKKLLVSTENETNVYELQEAASSVKSSAKLPTSTKVGRLNVTPTANFDVRGANQGGLRLSGDGDKVVSQQNRHVLIRTPSTILYNSEWGDSYKNVVALGDLGFIITFAATSSRRDEVYFGAGNNFELISREHPKSLARLADGRVIMFSYNKLFEVARNAQVAPISFPLPSSYNEIMAGGTVPDANRPRVVSLVSNGSKTNYALVITDIENLSNLFWTFPDHFVSDLLSNHSKVNNFDDSRILMTSSNEGIIQLRDNYYIAFQLAPDGAIKNWAFSNSAEHIDISPDGRLLSAFADNKVYIFNASEWVKTQLALESESSAYQIVLERDEVVTNVSFAPQGNKILVGTKDKVTVYDIEEEGAQ